MEAQEDAPLTTAQATQTLTRMLTDQAVWSSWTITADPKDHDHGHRQTLSSRPLKNHPALTKPHASEIRGLWLRSLAAGFGEDETSNRAAVASGATAGQDAWGSPDTSTPSLRPLMNPAGAQERQMAGAI